MMANAVQEQKEVPVHTKGALKSSKSVENLKKQACKAALAANKEGNNDNPVTHRVHAESIREAVANLIEKKPPNNARNMERKKEVRKSQPLKFSHKEYAADVHI